MQLLFPNERRRPWPIKIYTDPEAFPIGWRLVGPNKLVIHVEKASIRNAVVSGYFELAKGPVDSFKKIRRRDSEGNTYIEDRVHVICLWYGRALKSGWLSLELPRNKELPKPFRGCTEKVIIDIGKPE